jgi:iron complex transport system ATP-binding protein
MIQLNDFSVGYGKRMLIEHATTTVPASCLTALIGRNGAGKSTLLRALGGLSTGYSGSVTIDGHELRDMQPRDLARRIAVVTTDRVRVAGLCSADVVALGRAPYTGWAGKLAEADREKVDDALAAVGMSDYATQRMDCMSDGECQRVMIARALAQDTPVILLDEPTSFLDLPNRFELCSLLASLAHERGKCVLFSTHELDIALHMADAIMLVDTPTLINLPTNRMVADGHIDRIFHIPEWMRNGLTEK